jgi:hypothetical protein
MKGTVRTANEEIYIGLKCDPNTCPRCHGTLTRAAICINLIESSCGCGYSARDRDGNLRYAQDVLDKDL